MIINNTLNKHERLNLYSSYLLNITLLNIGCIEFDKANIKLNLI